MDTGSTPVRSTRKVPYLRHFLNFVLHFVLHKQVKLLFRFRTILVACDMGDNGLSWFTGLSMIGTIAVYGLNIVNAFRGFDRQEGEKLAFYDMLIKLIHIPFYILVFVLGMLLAAVMVVPIFVMLTPFLILMLAIGDFFLMITSSMYGISAALRLGKTGEISKTASVIYFMLHFFFVADVISAILLYRSAKKRKEAHLLKILRYFNA